MVYPPTQVLSAEEKDLVWKFRFYLTRDKRVNQHNAIIATAATHPLSLQALTKFLKCVVWTDPTEVRQAIDLLPLWVDIDVDDALELLGKEFSNRSVRSYAVNQLRKADDDVRSIQCMLPRHASYMYIPGPAAVPLAASTGFEIRTSH